MLEIVIDTREQTPFHFDETVARVTRGTLKTGDYAVKGDSGFAVERKSLDDFLGTISKGWARFQREMYRASDAGFPSFPIVVEARFSDVIFTENGSEVVPPRHDHPSLSPAFVLKRIGQLSQIGGIVVFADGVNEATMLTYSFLRARNEELHKDDDNESSGQENRRKG